MSKITRRYLYFSVSVVVFILGLLYFFNNPADSAWFPKCPFLSVTGLQCPGCGSQRAVHALMHLRVGEAFAHNPLLVSAVPYLAAGILFRRASVQRRFPKMRAFLFGQTAIFVVLAVVLLFWVLRNVT
ncbi:DUF2752 domain-containing protein [Chryseobacterium sp. MFBS3-17]|uniref:DUF2752 domain-containing protein n=1 Tax=Chryseobacterium sp. MFBS3-17 TaxID=2886689 RepID=UPI001D0E13EB|nr:DUF2752 domain-containing protein [Chryseobacterium sp. MFBS3-17]